MIEALLPVVLLVGVATLALTVRTLRSARMAEDLGEDRFELLRDQNERPELLREERRMLIAELEKETSERQTFMESLRGTDPQLTEDLAWERQERTNNARRAERQEQEL